MSDMQIYNLFPTPVMRIANLVNQQQLAELNHKILTEHRETNSSSNQLSHTQPIKPSEMPEFSAISEKLGDYLRDFGFLLFGENLKWSIKEMWMNVLDEGGYQAMHSHANSFISGVIYLTPTNPATNTVFHRPMGGHDFVFSNNHEGSETTPYNGDRWSTADIQQGDCILFPSYVLHAVPRNEGQQRISLAFNAMPDKLKSWDYEISFAEVT